MRLIDADELKLADFQDFSNTDVFCAIDEALTIDAVPLVYGVPVPRNRPVHYDNYTETHCLDGEDVLYKRKHGIVDDIVNFCSVCDKRLCSRFENYCPNCGVKMSNEPTDEEKEAMIKEAFEMLCKIPIN